MASELTLDEVERIATLARLALDQDEKVRLAGELSRILDFAGQISALDTRDVQPNARFLGLGPVEREDVPLPSLSREAALSNAPEVSSSLFTVPRMTPQRATPAGNGPADRGASSGRRR